MARKKYESNLKKPAIGPLANDKPSNKFVIHSGRTLSIIIAASPNVKTTIRDDLLFSLNSSIYSTLPIYFLSQITLTVLNGKRNIRTTR